VNRALAERGIEYLNGHALTASDVVILPAFGAGVEAIERIRASGATIVDTTCGEVMNVWKKVGQYAERGVTAVIHGKAGHEESVATSSRAGVYVIVRDAMEARVLADFILGARGPFPLPASAGFDPARDLERIGLANQTTMLASESLDVERILREAMSKKHGDLSDRFFAFDTICSATQERQDAVVELIESGIDVLVVVGGANSSNTGHLVELGRRRGLPTFHVVDAVDASRILFKRPIVVGLTAGASTPSTEIERSVRQIFLSQ
jgi:4-hydroxy-3-methylbut-2-enyl diphosphate reductase